MIAPLAYLYLVLALFALPNFGTAAENNSTDTPIDFLNDGVLIIDGKQSSCEIALIGESYGLVAANCLLTDDGKQRKVKQLKIATHGSGDSEVIPVDDMVLHPQFDASTLANNIAVLTFTTSKDTIPSPMAPLNTTSWDDQCLFRRALNDLTPTWSNYILGRVSDKGKELCQVASPIFAANSNDFICDQGLVSPGDSITSCKLPYGMGYGAVLYEGTAPMALYSHTVVFGDGLCSTSQKVNYYILLHNYLDWGQSIADAQKSKSLKIPHSANAAKNNSQKIYQMNPPENPVPVVQTYGGNLYAHLPTPIFEPTSSTTTSDVIDESSGNEQESSSDYEESSGDYQEPSESPLPTSDTESDISSEQHSGFIPEVPSYSTTTVRITSYTTITTWSGSDSTSSAPSSFDGESSSDSLSESEGICTTCSNDSVSDSPSDDYDCTETVYITSDDTDSCTDAEDTSEDTTEYCSEDVSEPPAQSSEPSIDSSEVSSSPDSSTDDISSAPNSSDGDSGSNSEFDNVGTLKPYDPTDESTDSVDSANSESLSDSEDSEASSESEVSSDDVSNSNDDDFENVGTLEPYNPTDSSESEGSGGSQLDDSTTDEITDTNDSDDSQTDSDETTTDSDADSSPNNSNQESGGISRTTAILVGVLVPLAIIIIIVCLYFYFKKK
ncbi:hypothetical protein IWW36_002422 [Coemansia brasiliensis]|uniref:Peptidase S1 domain-containing protein n=1 Tax=Coemansia brasiliensis TaxID=2650707 RepID=A0A9W8LY54_9FUNG|nr:hypothetical protein IWW36_002422 [Coemansia brasiliensis]